MKKIILILFLILNLFFLLNCSKNETPSTPEQTCEKVTFPDANLEAAIRAQLNKPTGDICKSDCEAKTELYLYGYNISNIEGLQYFKNLEILDLSGNTINSINVLSGLTKLKSLNLSYNIIDNISALTNLTELTDLNLESNYISDISPLISLTKLIGLTLSDNLISDIGALSGLLNLQTLYLSNNQISDITALVTNANSGGLGSGDIVYLDGNPLSSQATDTDIPYLEGMGVSVTY